LISKKVALLGNKLAERESREFSESKESVAKEGDDISDIVYNPKNKTK
jgi:hypothetical protein